MEKESMFSKLRNVSNKFDNIITNIKKNSQERRQAKEIEVQEKSTYNDNCENAFRHYMSSLYEVGDKLNQVECYLDKQNKLNLVTNVGFPIIKVYSKDTVDESNASIEGIITTMKGKKLHDVYVNITHCHYPVGKDAKNIAHDSYKGFIKAEGEKIKVVDSIIPSNKTNNDKKLFNAVNKMLKDNFMSIQGSYPKGPQNIEEAPQQ